MQEKIYTLLVDMQMDIKEIKKRQDNMEIKLDQVMERQDIMEKKQDDMIQRQDKMENKQSTLEQDVKEIKSIVTKMNYEKIPNLERQRLIDSNNIAQILYYQMELNNKLREQEIKDKAIKI